MILATLGFLCCVGFTIVIRLFYLEKSVRNMKYDIEILRLRVDLILTHVEKKTEKLPPANRKPKSDAQKRILSQRRIEWWARKRAEDAKKPSAPELKK